VQSFSFKLKDSAGDDTIAITWDIENLDATSTLQTDRV
jgi:hypothetical protein